VELGELGAAGGAVAGRVEVEGVEDEGHHLAGLGGIDDEGHHLAGQAALVPVDGLFLDGPLVLRATTGSRARAPARTYSARTGGGICRSSRDALA
jgi:hypothetical protein